MNGKHDIATLDDIKYLVDTFYDKVRDDATLAPVFNAVIQDRWLQHLEKMYTFWQTVLLGEHTYFSSPFPPHAKLPVDHAHFEQWLQLFTQTIDELFSGDTAEEAVWRANKMAQLFEMKIEHYRNQQFKTLI
ncbi:group III truncated hemoglobin [Ilyomonas limi]|uniref:Group III truncated hemoglobin n=1 Tax=Ilyomonas limi TaxID=2575867 RepID=A0A4U3L909_9BACT|nr:group III truncated hemoglobin [Ilyomonas limi]TKK71009.1 group III truncated hemoglobin [Ilyomonas limi]